MYIGTEWLWAHRFYKLLLFETIEKIIKIFANKAIGQYLCKTLYNFNANCSEFELTTITFAKNPATTTGETAHIMNDEIIFQWCEWYNLAFNFDH